MPNQPWCEELIEPGVTYFRLYYEVQKRDSSILIRLCAAVADVVAHGDPLDREEILVRPAYNGPHSLCGTRVDDCAADGLLLLEDTESIIRVRMLEVPPIYPRLIAGHDIPSTNGSLQVSKSSGERLFCRIRRQTNGS